MIRKFFSRSIGLVMIAVLTISCEAFDDSVLNGKINDLEKRVTTIEELCRQMNTNITALQQIVNASQNGLYIVSVSPFSTDGKDGYIIVFSDKSSIVIYNGKDGQNGTDGKDGQNGTDGKDGQNGADGKDGQNGADGKDGQNGTDGKDGQNGADGKDGSTPVIGIRQDSDGIYYWTINGEWMLDGDGNKLKAVGSDGKDGQNGTDGKDGADGKDGVTPKFKIEDGYWFISYDGGTTWEKLGAATGADGEPGASGDNVFVSVDTSDPNKVVFTLSGGQTITLPTWTAFDALQKKCDHLNANVASMQTILEAIQERDYVLSVTPVIEDGDQTGYVIVFAKAGSVVIYNGKDGQDGANGADGQDGTNGKDGADGATPLIGVKKDADGMYYWTVNGEWLLDEKGNKVPATGASGTDGNDGVDGADGADGANGADGADGKDGITPKFKIEAGKWWVSYDEGQSWTELGQATGDPGKDGSDGQDGQNGTDGKDGADGKDGDSFFQSVTQDEMYVYLTLADGTVYTIPKKSAFSIELDADDVRFSLGNTYYIGYTLVGTDETASITVFTSDGLKARVEKTNATEGNIIITAPSAIVERSTVAVILSDGFGRTYTKAINFIYEGINDIENGVLVITTAEPLEFGAEGGNLVVPIQTNLNYSVEIDSNSASWLSYMPSTKAAALRDDEVKLSATANTGMVRHGFVYLVDVADKSILQTICVTQDADSEYLSATVTFSDPKFKSFILSAYDTDASGTISREEALKIKSLAISSKSISNLTGIEYFANLESIDCSSNSIANLDLSGNTALRSLKCSNTSLSSLNISKNILLEILDCSSTKIVSLDLSSNIALKSVDCSSNNSLTSVVIGKKDELSTFVCKSTGISSLDLSKCPALTSLDCSSTKLSEIDLSSNPALSSVNLSYCAWTNIDFGTIPYIKEINFNQSSSSGLVIRGGNLTSIEIPSCSSVKYIDCRNCPNLCKFSAGSSNGGSTPVVGLFNFSGLKNLKEVYISFSGATDILIDDTGAIEKFKCIDSYFINYLNLKNLDLTGNPHLKSLYLVAAKVSGNFDITGLNELETLTIRAEATLPQLTSKELKTIELSNCLNESLDLSQLSSLQSLTLSGFANLTSLKLPISSVLTKLDLSYMDALSSLDLSRQLELSSFSCKYGRVMDNLDLSRNLKLGTLTLSNIKGLLSLDLGDNSLVRNVEISNPNSNYCLKDVKVKGSKITKFYSSWVSPDLSECPMLTDVGMSNVPCGTLDFTKNPKLISVNCFDGYGSSFARGNILSIDVSGCFFLKTLKCRMNTIQSLNLAGCTNLQTLDCDDNLLESIDLSECTSLTSLNCYNNLLQTLDVSANSRLKSLDCSPMDYLETVYVSADQSIKGITYDRNTSCIPESTELVVK